MNTGKPQTFELIEKLKDKIFIHPLKTSYLTGSRSIEFQDGERMSLLLDQHRQPLDFEILNIDQKNSHLHTISEVSSSKKDISSADMTSGRKSALEYSIHQRSKMDERPSFVMLDQKVSPAPLNESDFVRPDFDDE